MAVQTFDPRFHRSGAVRPLPANGQQGVAIPNKWVELIQPVQFCRSVVDDLAPVLR